MKLQGLSACSQQKASLKLLCSRTSSDLSSRSQLSFCHLQELFRDIERSLLAAWPAEPWQLRSGSLRCSADIRALISHAGQQTHLGHILSELVWIARNAIGPCWPQSVAFLDYSTLEYRRILEMQGRPPLMVILLCLRSITMHQL